MARLRITIKRLSFIVPFVSLLFLVNYADAQTGKEPLTISGSKALPPFTYLDETNTPKGLLVDYWLEYGRVNDKQIIFKLVTWKESIDLVRQGKADLHSGIYFSEKRNVFLDFSEQLPVPIPGRLFVSQKLNVSNIHELDNIPVGVIGGGFSEEFMHKEFPDVQIRLFPTSKRAIEAGFSGEILAFITDYPTAMYYMHNIGSPDQYQVLDTLYTHHMRAAVKEGNRALLQEIEAGISRVPTQKVERLLKRWVWGLSVEIIPSWLYPALAGTIVVFSILFMGVHTRTLKHQVAARTQELKQEINDRIVLETNLKKSEATLKESETRLKTAGKVSYDLIYEWNVQTDHLEWFGDIDSLLGYEQGEISREITTWLSLIHPDDQSKLSDAVDHHRTSTKPIQFDYRIRHKDGHYRYWMDNGLPLLDSTGKPYRWVGVCTDITERKEMEEQLRINRDQAEQANQAKSEFLAAMSHEIRTPINSILGLCELMSHTPLNTKQSRYLLSLNTASQSLFSLLNNILDFSRIEAGELALELAPFSLVDLLEEVSQIFICEAQDSGIHLTCESSSEIPSQLLGDETHLRQVLINLVGNALKFTEEGTVTLTATLTHSDPGLQTHDIQFDIVDTGIGIDEAESAELFQPFSQANPSMNRRYGGTGLGLVISQQLVHLMGGNIQLESSPQRGTRVSFSLRFTEAGFTTSTIVTESNNNLESQSIEHATSLSILLVEDEPITQLVTMELLEEAGFQVMTAINGHEALERVVANSIDLILMDLRMPDMDGMEASRRIRQMEQEGVCSHTRIIGLTADVVTTTISACKAAGMDHVLAKPINSKQLHQAILELT
ncbi:MAG: transporter substrate-binding domain-containing protein [Magnetococcales bacterium]|nr:transporter substrate-binding domain-containing protein [Magnetococcales bacterium]